MKKSKLSFPLFIVITLFPIVSFYNACSRDNLGGFKIDQSRFPASQSVLPLALKSDSAIDLIGNMNNKISTSVLTADQILRSSLSITNVIIDSNIQNEFNARYSLLATNYDLNQLNSPMWIAIANINSYVCQSLVSREAALMASQREFFINIDFTKPVSQLSAEVFIESASLFSVKAWARELYPEEQSALLTAKDEFVTAIPAASINSSQQTKNLMMFMCTAILSSAESITL